MKNKVPFLICILTIIILLKFWYSTTELHDVIALLKPVNEILELILNQSSTLIDGSGYYFSTLNIIIDKSCSGFNLLIFSFSILSGLGVMKYDKIGQHILVILTAFALAYVFTVLVNSFRIYVSIFIEEGILNSLFQKRQHYKVHQGIGLITNVSFLILLFLGTNKLLISNSHE